MTRKEWLEAFLRCVDTGASTLDFRRYCRVKAQHLPRHMSKTQSYRDELARLNAEEELTPALPVQAEEETQSEVEDERPAESGEDKDNDTSTEDEGQEDEGEEESRGFRWPGSSSWGDEETLGTREDSGDDPDLHG